MLLLYCSCSNKDGCRLQLGTTWGHMGHMKGHLGVQERPREGHVLQMLFFHWFYKHFQASREGASESFVIEVVGRRRQWAQNALFCNGFRRQKQSWKRLAQVGPAAARRNARRPMLIAEVTCYLPFLLTCSTQPGPQGAGRIKSLRAFRQARVPWEAVHGGSRARQGHGLVITVMVGTMPKNSALIGCLLIG